jgi:hypothetical protein
MEPINSKERTSAVIKFALLLLLTIIVVVGAILFDIKVPTKRLAVLQRENAMLKASLGDEVNVLVRLDSINDQFLRLDSDITPITAGTISGGIIEMSKMAGTDTSVKGKTLKQVLTAYKMLLDTKSALKRSGASTGEIAKLQKDLEEMEKDFEECKRDKKDCERDLAIYKR